MERLRKSLDKEDHVKSNQLTLDEIRKGLSDRGSTTAGGRVRRSTHDDHWHAPDDVDVPVDNIPVDIPVTSLEERQAGLQALSRLCEEVLVFCSLLDSSRLRAVEEGTRLQKTIRQLEALLDAAPQREMEHLNQVDQMRQLQAALDQKYRFLKGRAKQLIRDCGENRDRRQIEYQKANSHLQTLENELFSLQTLVANQRKELEREREANLSLKSPRDVKDLDMRLRALDKDNQELRVEKETFQRQHDELAEALLAITKMTADPAKTKAAIRRTEHILHDVLEAKQAEEEAQARELEVLTADVKRYETYATELLRRLDG